MIGEPHDGERFEDLLALREDGDGVFTVRLVGYGGASFGGQTMGCAARAAGLTCADRTLHALHAVFLRPVPPERPVELRVERIRSGRRFAQRSVRVECDDRLLCEIVASFAARGEGATFGDAIAPPLPDPESLADDASVARAEGEAGGGPNPWEWRWVGAPWQRAAGESSRYSAWVRPRHALVAEPVLRAAALAYLADSHSHVPVARMLGRGFVPQGFVSLDQALWIHRDEPWREWRLLHSECDVASGGRALTRRQLFARDGRLLASMAQEALIVD